LSIRLVRAPGWGWQYYWMVNSLPHLSFRSASHRITNSHSF